MKTLLKKIKLFIDSFMELEEKEEVKHAWKVRSKFLTENHKDTIYAYQCEDCFKVKYWKKDDMFDNCDLAYKNEVENYD